jgi:predicted ATP-dependent endonuclease of OLD family
MKIKKVKIKNFRSYKNEIEINFGNLTAFVGKNDIGKSTILEALDVFFNENKGIIKLDKDDINKGALAVNDTEIMIAVCFDALPTTIVIDTSNETTLHAEYLLNEQNELEIIKRYPNAGKEKVFVKAYHPTNTNCKDLLQKKDTELRAIIDAKGIVCTERNKNATMRTAIWNHYASELELEEIELDVTKGDTKSIWDKLQNYLPMYSLFQSDRKNSDGDSEVQDPLKEAVKQILNNEQLKAKFIDIANEVENKLKEVATRTLEKVREMNPEIANNLNPIIPPADGLKWADVFKSVSITGDDDIPINKRGSGVKRLILLNFFRAEAERRKLEQNIPSIIYAIEEPETSQHAEHQKKLIEAFVELSNVPQTQIVLTTHSSILVKKLDFKHLRLIKDNNGEKTVENVIPNQLPYVSLNEINFIAFADLTEEYHNELYGFLEHEDQLTNFKLDKPTILYKKIMKDGTIREEQKVLSEYIRHQIHHPENTNNDRYSPEDLESSINQMRAFILNYRNI